MVPEVKKGKRQYRRVELNPKTHVEFIQMHEYLRKILGTTHSHSETVNWMMQRSWESLKTLQSQMSVRDHNLRLLKGTLKMDPIIDELKGKLEKNSTSDE